MLTVDHFHEAKTRYTFIADCGGLPNPANGTVTASQTTFGQVATYECNMGYKMQGISIRTCQPDGFWSVKEPTCLPKGTGIVYIQVIKDCSKLFSQPILYI